MQNYNCDSSVDNSYGATSYGNCTSQVGVPNTGLPAALASGLWLEAGLGAIGLALIIIAVAMGAKRRKRQARATDASL